MKDICTILDTRTSDISTENMSPPNLRLAEPIDELLSPSLSNSIPLSDYSSNRPIDSILIWIVVIVGGVLPSIAIAYINAKRLNVSREGIIKIITVGVFAFLISVLTFWYAGVHNGATGDNYDSVRVVDRFVAILYIILCARIQYVQESAYRHRLLIAGKPASQLYSSISAIEFSIIFLLGLIYELIIRAFPTFH